MKAKIRNIIASILPEGAIFDVSVSPREDFGHYSTNAALRLAKEQTTYNQQLITGSKAPMEIAEELAKKLEAAAPKGMFSKIEAAAPGFVNFWLTNEVIRDELAAISANETFGTSESGKGQTVIVEFSSPNIAKKMHVGQLRNTIIGDALANLYTATGYTVIRWNYLGDWGTQFGKLIAAYKLWGDERAVKEHPIQALLDLYIRFHSELAADPELDNRGREEFKKLEVGDAENRKLWEWFREESVSEFKRIYNKLGVGFDVWVSESFFEDKMKPIVDDLRARGLAVVSEGALVVHLDQFGLPPALIEKSDGTSLYLTRDLANIRYRVTEYTPKKILYVVGNEQTLHFEQVFRVASLLSLSPQTELMHVKYGLVLAEEGKKFSTREGRIVFAEEIIEKATQLARTTVEQKNKELTGEEKDKVAESVALGALKYANLHENRNSDIRFDWKKVLDFHGDSGPYLQYTYARMQSILRKVADGRLQVAGDAKYLETEQELGLVRKMMEFPDVVEMAAEMYAPNHLCTYLFELANLANAFYESTPILSDENIDRRNARLLLVSSVAKVLEKGLGILGIKALEKI